MTSQESPENKNDGKKYHHILGIQSRKSNRIPSDLFKYTTLVDERDGQVSETNVGVREAHKIPPPLNLMMTRALILEI